MIPIKMNTIAKRHCSKQRPAVTLKSFIRDHYEVSHQFFSDVAHGSRGASPKLLKGMANAHHRLFPDEAILVEIPNHPPIVLGDPKNLHRSAK